MKVIHLQAKRQQLLLRRVAGARRHEADVKRVAGGVELRVGKWLVTGDVCQLRCRSNEGSDGVTECLLQGSLYFPFERGCTPGRCIENDIPAGYEGFNLSESERLEQTTQVVHLHGVATDVYRSQKGNVFWHDVCGVQRPYSP